MGNGAKIALVALLIVMVVVVAKVVQHSGDGESATTGQPGATLAKAPGGTTPASGASSAQSSRTPARKITLESTTRSSTTPTPGATGRPPATSSPGTGARRILTGPYERAPGTGPGARTGTPTGEGAPASRPAGTATGTGTGPATSGSPTKIGGSDRTPETAGDAPPGESRTTAGDSRSVILKATAGEGGAGTAAGSPGGTRTESTTGTLGSGAPITGAPTTRDFSAPDRSAPSASSLEREMAKSKTTPDSIQGITRPLPVTRSANPGAFPVTYTAQPGDSYWELARRHYGNANQYSVIQDANGGKPLIAGKEIVIPPPPPTESKDAGEPDGVATPAREGGAPPPETTAGDLSSLPGDATYAHYTAQKGDTLMGIAKRFYGKTGAYTRILEANRRLNYESLKAGDKLRLPRSVSR